MKTARYDQESAVQQLLRQRGGPQVNTEPVIITDDLRDGPYFPFQTWMHGSSIAAAVGFFSVYAIRHYSFANGQTDRGARVVVDRITLRQSIAGSFFLTIAAELSPNVTESTVLDRTTTGQGPQWVAAGFNNSTQAALPGQRVELPRGDTLPQDYYGPWVLLPGNALYLYTANANTALFASAVGRYYAGS